MRWHEERTLTVGGLNRAVRLSLEQTWGDVRVVGEIGDLSRAASGHVYFTLNDENEAAQVRVVMFKSDVRRTRATLENGARICVRGSLTLFEPRGTFQLLARAAVPAGEGDLGAQFKRLLQKLAAEGLTDPARKRPLPLLPRCIGLVTSEHGAAVHDVLRVARERCPVRVVVAPCLVQGPEAPRSIVRALRAVQRVPELDVVIVARGGGGAEDLWAFNDEAVARAIAACRVPVVTGIGHETDTTIADWVADVRAATPSNAAEVVVPKHERLEEQLAAKLRMLTRAMESRLARERLLLSRQSVKLKDPRALLAGHRARLQVLSARSVRAIEDKLERARGELHQRTRRVNQRDPRARLSAQRAAFERLKVRLEILPARRFVTARNTLRELHLGLERAMDERLVRERHQFAALLARMHALSPLAVLQRGYAIALSERTGKALCSAAEAEPGDFLRLRLHAGSLRAQVLERLPPDPTAQVPQEGGASPETCGPGGQAARKSAAEFVADRPASGDTSGR